MKRKHISSHYFEKGKPVHKPSFCAFMDILGFNHKVKESFISGDEDRFLEKFYCIHTGFMEKLKQEMRDVDADKKTRMYSASFTDNILLGRPIVDGNADVALFQIIELIAEYQCKMAIEGLFIRGGLDLGPLFMGDHGTTGLALLKAYFLETKKAKAPIVILSDAARRLVQAEQSENVDTPHNSILLCRGKSTYFINYLSKCCPDECEEPDRKMLLAHKRSIVAQLKSTSGTVRKRFHWLAEYHNFFCVRYKNLSKLKIPLTETTARISELPEQLLREE